MHVHTTLLRFAQDCDDTNMVCVQVDVVEHQLALASCRHVRIGSALQRGILRCAISCYSDLLLCNAHHTCSSTRVLVQTGALGLHLLLAHASQVCCQ